MTYDLAIIGGIVGLATALEVTGRFPGLSDRDPRKGSRPRPAPDRAQQRRDPWRGLL
jgi:hypothetical protein